MFVYAAYCTNNGKVYVGKTVKHSITLRWNEHVADSNRGKPWSLHRAIRKYGKAAFELQQLAEVKTEVEAINLEKLWILLLMSYDRNFGYNLTMGGDGCTPTEETRNKIKAALPRGKNHPLYRHDVNTERIVSLYKSGLTGKQVAKKVSCCTQVVFKRLRQRGVYIRPSGHRNNKVGG